MNKNYKGMNEIGEEGMKGLSKTLWTNLRELHLCRMFNTKMIAILETMVVSPWQK